MEWFWKKGLPERKGDPKPCGDLETEIAKLVQEALFCARFKRRVCGSSALEFCPSVERRQMAQIMALMDAEA